MKLTLRNPVVTCGELRTPRALNGAAIRRLMWQKSDSACTLSAVLAWPYYYHGMSKCFLKPLVLHIAVRSNPDLWAMGDAWCQIKSSNWAFEAFGGLWESLPILSALLSL